MLHSSSNILIRSKLFREEKEINYEHSCATRLSIAEVSLLSDALNTGSELRPRTEQAPRGVRGSLHLFIFHLFTKV